MGNIQNKTLGIVPCWGGGENKHFLAISQGQGAVRGALYASSQFILRSLSLRPRELSSPPEPHGWYMGGSGEKPRSRACGLPRQSGWAHSHPLREPSIEVAGGGGMPGPPAWAGPGKAGVQRKTKMGKGAGFGKGRHGKLCVGKDPGSKVT